MNLEAPPGTKRPRKRGRTQKDLQPLPTPLMEKPAYIPVMPIRLEQPVHHRPPMPSQQRVVPPPHPPPPPPRREEGAHPPMHSTILRPVDAHSFKTSAVRHSPYDEDDEDEMDWGPGGPQMMSDEDFSDEEPVNHSTSYHHYQAPLSAASSSSTSTGYHRPTTHSPVNHTGHTNHTNHTNHVPPHPSNRTGLHGVFSSNYQPAPPPEGPTILRLKQDIDNLKRHSTDQESLVIRLNNSLTRAETDAARAKQALKMAESRLEDESRRRVEAERAADEEARLRRHAEEQLRSYQMRAAGLPSPR